MLNAGFPKKISKFCSLCQQFAWFNGHKYQAAFPQARLEASQLGNKLIRNVFTDVMKQESIFP